VTVKQPYAGPVEVRGDFDMFWVDRGHPPRQPPNPHYLEGCDVDLSDGKQPTCMAVLPYPSPHDHVGTWMIRCLRCGQRVGVTTASRVDDARSVKLACQGRSQ
jgi:hypothetical protein